MLGVGKGYKHKMDLTSSKSVDLCQKIFTLVVCGGRIQKILCVIYYILYIHSCSMWEGGFRRAEPGALSLVEHNAFKGLGGR